jgi:predicted nucleotidyltransferase
MVSEATIIKAAELLREAAHPTRIILFGSHARGVAQSDSDVALMVILPKVRDRMAEMVRLNRILSSLRVPVDLLVVSEEVFEYWANTPGNVYFEVAVEGRVLYEQAA